MSRQGDTQPLTADTTVEVDRFNFSPNLPRMHSKPYERRQAPDGLLGFSIAGQVDFPVKELGSTLW